MCDSEVRTRLGLLRYDRFTPRLQRRVSDFRTKGRIFFRLRFLEDFSREGVFGILHACGAYRRIGYRRTGRSAARFRCGNDRLVLQAVLETGSGAAGTSAFFTGIRTGSAVRGVTLHPRFAFLFQYGVRDLPAGCRVGEFARAHVREDELIETLELVGRNRKGIARFRARRVRYGFYFRFARGLNGRVLDFRACGQRPRVFHQAFGNFLRTFRLHRDGFDEVAFGVVVLEYRVIEVDDVEAFLLFAFRERFATLLVSKVDCGDSDEIPRGSDPGIGHLLAERTGFRRIYGDDVRTVVDVSAFGFFPASRDDARRGGIFRRLLERTSGRSEGHRYHQEGKNELLHG